MLKIIGEDGSGFDNMPDADRCTDFQSNATRAKTHIEGGDWEAAYPYLKRAVEMNPNYAEGYNHLGVFYSRNKNYMEAINNFKKALRCDFTLIEAHYNIGSLYVERKEYNMALPHFKEVVLANPEDYETYFLMGLCSIHCNEENAAEAFFTESCKLNRDYAPSVIELSKLLIKKENLGKAKNILLCLLMNEPSNAEVHFLLGIIYKAQKKYVKAIHHLRETLMKNQNAEAYNLLGECCLESGIEADIEKEAEAFFVMATRLDTSYSDAYLNLGNFYYSRKRYFDAISTLEEYVKYTEAIDNVNVLWSDSPKKKTEEMVPFYNLLGCSYKMTKNSFMARTFWEKSLAIQPQQESIKNALSSLEQPINLHKRISLTID